MEFRRFLSLLSLYLLLSLYFLLYFHLYSLFFCTFFFFLLYFLASFLLYFLPSLQTWSIWNSRFTSFHISFFLYLPFLIYLDILSARETIYVSSIFVNHLFTIEVNQRNIQLLFKPADVLLLQHTFSLI